LPGAQLQRAAGAQWQDVPWKLVRIKGGTSRTRRMRPFGGLNRKRKAAFNAAIETAVLDPDQAAKFTTGMMKQPRHLSPAFNICSV
jgi:hypothetical protein